MAPAIERGLRQLEGFSVVDDDEGDKDFAHLSLDELIVLRWRWNRSEAADAKVDDASRAERKRAAEETDAEIVARARRFADPDCVRYLEVYRSAWKSRTGNDDYVPALTAHDEDGGAFPDIMRRRAALWAMPDVQELIGPEAAAAVAAQMGANQHLALHPYCIFNEDRCRAPEPFPKADADFNRWLTRPCRGDCAGPPAAEAECGSVAR